MKIAIGADHAGFRIKEALRSKLAAEGHQLVDFGTSSEESTDYPDYAQTVGTAVASGQVDRGILVCKTGVGMSIAANKIHGVRAGLGVTPEEVALIRKHNDANILALGAVLSTPEQAAELTDIFLATDFEGGRHARRVGKISKLEEPNQK